MTEALIVASARTPIGRYAGSLSHSRPDDLAALVVAEVVRRSGIDPELVDEVVLGAANQAGEDNRNVARMALLLAGLPISVPGITVNRLCASGLSSIALARSMVASGDAEVVVAGGVESMSRAPWVLQKPSRPFSGPGAIHDTSIGWRFPNVAFGPDTTLAMTETAQRVADKWKISREEMDEFAVTSHRRATRAVDEHKFVDEIVPVPHDGTTSIWQDEGPRRDTSMDALGRLKPVTGPHGSVTAGNSSSLNDGAAAVLVVSDRFAEANGLTPLARIVASANVGVRPDLMGIGPVPATRAVLQRVGWSADDLDVVELNEAFASQSLACIRELGLDPMSVNADGGAIALGHPLGCSGTRIVVTLLGRLKRESGQRGLATMCVGVGQGTSLLLERV
jgi:acetyl-CoA acetyltransferase family protein